MDWERRDTAPTGRETPSGPEQPLPVYTSGELFAGHKELVIVHEQERYRLRITRRDKLILTK